jgi:hypothetical protein
VKEDSRVDRSALEPDHSTRLYGGQEFLFSQTPLREYNRPSSLGTQKSGEHEGEQECHTGGDTYQPQMIINIVPTLR